MYKFVILAALVAVACADSYGASSGGYGGSHGGYGGGHGTSFGSSLKVNHGYSHGSGYGKDGYGKDGYGGSSGYGSHEPANSYQNFHRTIHEEAYLQKPVEHQAYAAPSYSKY